jgi:hypothetical protein
MVSLNLPARAAQLLLSAVTAFSAIASLAVGAPRAFAQISDQQLSYFSITAPTAPPAATASVTASLNFDGRSGDGQWRLFGELQWRASGSAATGLIGGNYVVEFAPIASYQTPANQTVQIAAGESATVSAAYTANDAPPTGALSVTLAPNVGAWRRVGTTAWHSSGDVEEALTVGSYLVEFQPATGQSTTSRSSCRAIRPAPRPWFIAHRIPPREPRLCSSRIQTTPERCPQPPIPGRTPLPARFRLTSAWLAVSFRATTWW